MFTTLSRYTTIILIEISLSHSHKLWCSVSEYDNWNSEILQSYNYNPMFKLLLTDWLADSIVCVYVCVCVCVCVCVYACTHAHAYISVYVK